MISEHQTKIARHIRDRHWEFLSPLCEQLGFIAVEIMPPALLPDVAVERFEQWLDRGFHADMAYLTRHQAERFDIRKEKILKGATAVITAALPYGFGAIDAGFWRYISAHARGRDYHRTIKSRLALVAREIELLFPGSTCRVFADTAPLAERSLAILSGLGALGKNGQIIIRNFGSRVVLGEIVCAGTPLPQEASPTRPFELCGDCAACLKACPLQAIVEPGVIDSNRCLSYWTIENRERELPTTVARKVNKIFGCEDCLTACPLNSHAVFCSLELPKNKGGEEMTIQQIAEISDTALFRLIEGTALDRTGPALIRRNAKALTWAR